jgi:porphyrinogen peroxidase
VRALCGALAALLRAVGFRDLEGRLSCVMAFGSDAWDRLFGVPKPKALHPFREIRGRHHAPATPGDILFHLRSSRMDLCFELATQIMSRLGGAVSTVDEVHGFNYFDDRDLIGFVAATRLQPMRCTPLSRQFQTEIKIGCYTFEPKYTIAGV